MDSEQPQQVDRCHDIIDFEILAQKPIKGRWPTIKQGLLMLKDSSSGDVKETIECLISEVENFVNP